MIQLSFLQQTLFYRHENIITLKPIKFFETPQVGIIGIMWIMYWLLMWIICR